MLICGLLTILGRLRTIRYSKRNSGLSWHDLLLEWLYGTAYSSKRITSGSLLDTLMALVDVGLSNHIEFASVDLLVKHLKGIVGVVIFCKDVFT